MDIAIIGSGPVGMTSALLLARQGHRIGRAYLTFKIKDEVASHIERGVQNLMVQDFLEIDRAQAELEIAERSVEHFAVDQTSVDPATLELSYEC